MLSSASTKPPLRGVVFDIDGTLTVPNLDFNEMYSRCGVATTDDILLAVAAKPQAEREAAEAIIEEMEETSRRTLELMPGAANVVAWLHARNVPTAVVTRNTAKTIEAVSRCITGEEIVRSPCFLPSISRDDAFPSKPDPACFEHIAAAWGTSGSGIVMVGDSPSNDVSFGKAANAATVLLDTGRRHIEGGTDGGADWVVASLTELPALLKEHYADVPPLEKCFPRSPPHRARDLLHSLHTLCSHRSSCCCRAYTGRYDTPQPTTEAARAACAGDVTALRALHASGSLETDACGNTPLIWAAERGQFEATAFLLSVASADEVNARGYLGATAVNRAARRGEAAVLEALVADERTRPSLDAHNDKRQTPLHFAAFKRHPACVRVLLAGGADPRVRDRKGRTPDEDTDVEAIRVGIRKVRAGADPATCEELL